MASTNIALGTGVFRVSPVTGVGKILLVMRTTFTHAAPKDYVVTRPLLDGRPAQPALRRTRPEPE